jgi:hypothetical protein
MPESKIDEVRKVFADLTAQLEDVAQIASEGQGVGDLQKARRHWERLAVAVERIGRGLQRLEKRLT